MKRRLVFLTIGAFVLVSMASNEECIKNVSSNSVFYRGEEGQVQRTVFKTENLQSVSILHDCKKKISYSLKGADTTYFISDNRVRFIYKTPEESILAFNSIIGSIKKMKNGRVNQNLLDYFKAGKVMVLDEDECEILMYSTNSCANPKKLESYYENAIRLKKTVFMVKCGGLVMESNF